MEGKVLIDTNILIYVFSNQLSAALTEQMNRFFQESYTGPQKRDNVLRCAPDQKGGAN